MQRRGFIPSAKSFRTELCWNWLLLGTCRYGDNCAFILDPHLESPSEAPRRHMKASDSEDVSPQRARPTTPLGIDATLWETFNAVLTGEGDQLSKARLPTFRAITP
jgi:hypothetical protein